MRLWTDFDKIKGDKGLCKDFDESGLREARNDEING